LKHLGIEFNEADLGRLARLAIERDRRDQIEGKARGLRYHPRIAQRAVDFFSFLRHSKGDFAGKEFKLGPWQEFCTKVLFGWLRRDGNRRFRRGYVSTGKKSGKSTLGAGWGLLLTGGDGEAGAEVYSAALIRNQARIVHEEAVRMVRASPLLQRRFRLTRDNISVPRLGAKYVPVSADADVSDGLNVHGAIVDEIHRHKNRKMWDILEAGTVSRRQPLNIGLTTAGFDRNSICYELYNRAVKVLEGSLEDDSYFAFICELERDEDWKDTKLWVRANPNIGITPKWDGLLEEFNRAKESPAKQNVFRRLHLNQWTEQSERYIDMEAWLACAGHVDPEELRGARCYGGLDLGSTRDLSALVLDFPVKDDDRRHRILAWFWLPKEGMAKRVERDRVPYDVWVERGLIKLTEGNSTDYGVVREDIKAIRSQYQILELAYDDWHADELATKLMDEGLNMVEFRQGFKSMNEPTVALYGLIADRRIEHGSNPVLNWMAGNVAVKQDPTGSLKPDKSKSTERIDGIVALIMAHGRAIRHSSPQSAYKKHGIRVF